MENKINGIIVEDNVPLPRNGGHRTDNPFKQVLREMEEGQSFVITAAEHSGIKSLIWRIHVQTERRFTIRKDGQFYRVWRIK